MLHAVACEPSGDVHPEGAQSTGDQHRPVVRDMGDRLGGSRGDDGCRTVGIGRATAPLRRLGE